MKRRTRSARRIPGPEWTFIEGPYAQPIRVALEQRWQPRGGRCGMMEPCRLKVL